MVYELPKLLPLRSINDVLNTFCTCSCKNNTQAIQSCRHFYSRESSIITTIINKTGDFLGKFCLDANFRNCLDFVTVRCFIQCANLSFTSSLYAFSLAPFHVLYFVVRNAYEISIDVISILIAD